MGELGELGGAWGGFLGSAFSLVSSTFPYWLVLVWFLRALIGPPQRPDRGPLSNRFVIYGAISLLRGLATALLMVDCNIRQCDD